MIGDVELHAVGGENPVADEVEAVRAAEAEGEAEACDHLGRVNAASFFDAHFHSLPPAFVWAAFRRGHMLP